MQDEKAKEVLAEHVAAFTKACTKVFEGVAADYYANSLPYILDDTRFNAATQAECILMAFMAGDPPEFMEDAFIGINHHRAMMGVYEANKELIENAIIQAQASIIDRLQRELRYAEERRI